MTMTLDSAPLQGSPEPVSLDLPFSAESAGVARGHLQQWMAHAGADDDRTDDARLLISELVGNAVRHARPLDDEVLRVEWRQQRSTLTIAVTDGGAGSVPEIVDAGLGDTSGRGMAIVDVLAHRWWVEADRTRTTVHVEIPLD